MSFVCTFVFAPCCRCGRPQGNFFFLDLCFHVARIYAKKSLAAKWLLTPLAARKTGIEGHCTDKQALAADGFLKHSQRCRRLAKSESEWKGAKLLLDGTPRQTNGAAPNACSFVIRGYIIRDQSTSYFLHLCSLPAHTQSTQFTYR